MLIIELTNGEAINVVSIERNGNVADFVSVEGNRKGRVALADVKSITLVND